MIATGDPKDEVSALTAGEVHRLLNVVVPNIRRPAAVLASGLAGAVVSAITGLSRRQQVTLAAHSQQIETEILDLIHRSANPAASLAPNQPKERSAADADGSSNVQRWAGDVAGPTELERRLKIARSTLHRWQRMGDVIAFRTGGRKFVFPVAQFVDGRPVGGLRTLRTHFPDPRAAWRWLVHPHSGLGDKTPLALLKANRIDEVQEAARTSTNR